MIRNNLHVLQRNRKKYPNFKRQFIVSYKIYELK